MCERSSGQDIGSFSMGEVCYLQSILFLLGNAVCVFLTLDFRWLVRVVRVEPVQ